MKTPWPIVPLAEVFDIARGGSPRPIDDFLTTDPAGVNWIMISDASESSKYIRSTKKRIVEDGVKRSRTVGPGDLLLTNSMSFGRPYIMKTSGCIHDGWLVLSPRNGKAHPDYFYHLLGSDFVYAEFERRAAGATVKNLNIELVKSVRVPLPPIKEQRRIAKVLDSANVLRDKRRIAIDKLNEFVESIFFDLFGDPTASKESGQFFPLESILAKPLQNGAYFQNHYYCSEGGVEMVHMSDAFYETVERGNLKRVHCTTRERKKYALGHNDILMARRSLNYEGAAKPCLVPKSARPLIFESSFIRVTPDPKKVTVLYLFHYLSNERVRQRFIRPFVTQSTISGINQSNLARVPVMVPKIGLQREFAKRLRAVEELRAAQRTSLSQMDKLFASLQHRAFRGDL